MSKPWIEAVIGNVRTCFARFSRESGEHRRGAAGRRAGAWGRWPAAGRWLLPLGVLLCAPEPRALALDPQRALTEYRSRILGQEDGLPCNGVLSLVQSGDGYLWLGTEEGLVRFDGVRARVFDRQTDPTLIGNFVGSVVEDVQVPGEILVGGAGGVYRLTEGKVRAFASDPALHGQHTKIIYQDRTDGAIWVQTLRGVCRVGPDGRSVDPAGKTPGWPTEKITALCRDEAGSLWVGTPHGLYRQRAPGGIEPGPGFEALPTWAGKEVECLVAARGGGLWVGSRDQGTGRLDPEGTFHPRAALTGFSVTALLEDRVGMLWVGTSGNGLFRLPAAEGANAGAPVASLTTSNGLVRNLVNGLCEDREGNLWIATGIGLQVLRDVRFVNFGRPEGLAGDDVRTILEDTRGRLWIGHDQGLSVLGPAGEPVENHSLPPSPHRPGDHHVLCGDRGDEDDTLLFGTLAGLVRWRAGALETVSLRDDLDRSTVRCLCRDGEGNRWVGTRVGLFQVRGQEVVAHLTTADGLAGDAVHALHLDRLGNLWIGTLGGFSRRGPDGRIETHRNSGDGQTLGRVDCFLENPDDPRELFFGGTMGLHRLRRTVEGPAQITRYSVREGLADDLVESLLSDDRGNLWMTSNKGISRVARADLARFDRASITTVPHVAYGLSDGLRSRECNSGHQPAACRDQRGQLWFATIKGAAMVDPTRVDPNPLPPPVYIEEVLVNGRALPTGTTSNVGGSPPDFPAGTQKLDLRYTALSLVAPAANRFRYRLEGFEREWTEAGTERAAHYTNLAPGRYRFAVQAANADGVWNVRGAALAFRVRPFLYQSRWFRALALAAGVAALGAGVQWLRWRWRWRLARVEAELGERTRTQEVLRIAKDAAERERGVAQAARAEAEGARAEAEAARSEAERANAAKSIFLSRVSHELRTPLNAILGFGQLLEMEALSAGQSDSVGHILGGGRHLLELVDEVLDLAHVGSGQAILPTEPIALAPLLAEVAGLVGPLADERSVRLRVSPATPDGSHVNANRQRLKQVLINLLGNAIKYNRPVAGEVAVGVLEASPAAATNAPRWRIFVRDTGAGIEPDGLAKLFIPFERLGAAYGPIQGTGLGLTVSRQLAEAMGGSIGVESTPGTGSTFWVDLPAVLASETPLTPPGATSQAPPRFPVPPSGPVHNSGLLYIEDYASNRDLLASLIGDHLPDIVLRCAVDGISGLESAHVLPRPKLILLDLQLPDISGDEVLRRLLADPETADIPVVILSADATTASQARLRTAGAVDYLTKPFDLDRLLRLLADHFAVPAARGVGGE